MLVSNKKNYKIQETNSQVLLILFQTIFFVIIQFINADDVICGLSSEWCLKCVDLLGSERGAHFSEGLQEVSVLDGRSLHVLLL